MTISAEPECSPLAIRSRFGELPVNGVVTLYEGPLLIHAQTTSAPGNGKVTFELLPDPSLRFIMEVKQAVLFLEENYTIDMISTGRSANALILGSNQSLPSGTGTFSGILIGDVRFTILKPDNSPEPIGRVQFHLINFHEYFGERLYIMNATSGSGLPCVYGLAGLSAR